MMEEKQHFQKEYRTITMYNFSIIIDSGTDQTLLSPFTTITYELDHISEIDVTVRGSKTRESHKTNISVRV